jgi:primosomal protein N' (replication factor Y) (superfamily II helicase)
MFVELVFPLPFRKAFTYSVPKEIESLVKTGVRAVAPFGKRTLTGFIVRTSKKSNLPTCLTATQAGLNDRITQERTLTHEIKPISDILDEKPIFDSTSLKFFQWMSDYYLSSFGEALKLAVPYGTEIESKKKIIVDRKSVVELLQAEKGKATIKKKMLEILSEKDEISFSYLQKILKRKNIYSIISSLENSGFITVLNQIESSKVRIKKEKFIRLNKSTGEIYSYFPELERRSPKQIKILLELISRKNEEIPLNYLLKKVEASISSIESLAKKDLLTIYEKEIDRRYQEIYTEKYNEIRLSEQQQKCVNEVSGFIKEHKFKSFLLHGVTGSGKTQVYIELVKLALEIKKTALILVPEISLTPQITSRMYNNFGDTVTVIHSGMSLGERYDSWRRILNGKSKVVIGARSALFAPLRKLGIIVVDEEHDASYKQFESVPKYNARDSAIVLAQINNCPVVLGSATPSLESMYNSKNGKHHLLSLPERIDNAKLPLIKLVNISIERKNKKMENVFSKVLLDHIEDRLRKKEGIIILQNRRGFSTHLHCEDCGEVEICDNCSVPMVYHINQNVLQCHYCGLIKKVPNACTHCGSLAIKYFGTGTERVEDELEFYFPGAKIRRVDSDSITGRSKLSRILLDFSKGDIDILVGTQMVSKGLDFSRVTLVGVISAETTLWLPDFRADERTFQLLTQVSGRAGRSKTEGEVIIQTQNEKNFTLQKVLMNDYNGFYANEIFRREKSGYPPFTRLCLIETKDKNEKKARGAIFDFHKQLIRYKKYIKISDPTTAVIAKIKGNYRFHILIKSSKETDPGSALMRKAVLDSFIAFNRRSRYRDVRLTNDVDPQSIL